MEEGFMKRKLCVLFAALLVLSFAGQAAAYFDDLNLIRSIYTAAGTTEIGSDLGSGVNTFTLNNPGNALRGDLTALSAFDGGQLQVGYWAHDIVNKDFYATGPVGGTMTMFPAKQATADGTMNPVQTNYAQGNSTSYTTTKATLGSYYNKFEVNGNNVGSMGSNLDSQPTTGMTASLADLESVGYIDQSLYFFNYDGSRTRVNGVAVATIRTYLTSDGLSIGTLINPVPVPAAVWLLGTGIVGLVGIRRRKN
jgi:hypothetical protein